MKGVALHNDVSNFLSKGLNQNRGNKPATLEGEKARLKKAAKEFESFFMYQMLKTMRATVPENPLVKDSPFANGLGKDTFTQIFDMEISRKMANGGKDSISEVLYNSLKKVIEAQFNGGQNQQTELKPLKPEDSVFNLPEKESIELKKAKPLEIDSQDDRKMLPLMSNFKTDNAQNLSKKPKAR